mmetsp:Transcript_36539/g.53610  ORF Transcript_36539/g.53610 Transcript_36539/m.53610 type:complete len:245 (-) Transcript_36539:250-984(-)|eukprot:CAMPEP_0195523326 /NCGR_PEP_ID=MMETSP0794_2-20130614/22362_1 /TAXON_ID=515487 /ORGANISM="Stephanopyxis turris, Strain CCMP 815" /LENGTH=244 /DNA_ID=CAMNT_0040653299 /DNA_START=152 /DNA_END=886 /DNA_ORIENTATION=+
MASGALDLIDKTIAELEANLGLLPGGSLPATENNPKADKDKGGGAANNKKAPKKKKKQEKQPPAAPKNQPANHDQPEICKLQFKVGQISKVWVHPDADKLYCEEIECGEDQPRKIASGLRMHYSESDMLGHRLLVVANLKPKNLVGFKSFGMVLCASTTNEDGTEKVEFIEPPEGAELGETITFEGLPTPEPLTPAQVEKKKVFAACMAGLKTTEDGVAAWNGHAFITSAGPCKSKTIKGGVMR